MGEQRFTQIGKKREFCGVMTSAITPGPAATPQAAVVISTLSFWGQLLQFPSICGSDFHMLRAKTSVLPLLLLISRNFSSRKELLAQEQQTLVRLDLSMQLPQGPTASPLLSKPISSFSPPLYGEESPGVTYMGVPVIRTKSWSSSGDSFQLFGGHALPCGQLTSVRAHCWLQGDVGLWLRVTQPNTGSRWGAPRCAKQPQSSKVPLGLTAAPQRDPSSKHEGDLLESLRDVRTV